MNHQFILDENQHPLFAVIPYNEYLQLFNPQGITNSIPVKINMPSLIPLPYGGPGAAINIPKFVEYWVRKGILSMPISQRAKKLDHFERREWISVETLVRICFVLEGYRNTMQVVGEVKDKLISTGLFREVRYDSAKLIDGHRFNQANALVTADGKTFNIERFSRSVKCLELIIEKVEPYLLSHPVKDDDQIQIDWWTQLDIGNG